MKAKYDVRQHSEWHQTFVLGRGGTWVDVVIDSLVISLVMVWALRTRRKALLAEN